MDANTFTTSLQTLYKSRADAGKKNDWLVMFCDVFVLSAQVAPPVHIVGFGGALVQPNVSCFLLGGGLFIRRFDLSWILYFKDSLPQGFFYFNDYR